MDPLAPNRARGEIRAAFETAGPRTGPARVFETGGYRLRLPRSHRAACEAVIVNTGGGMAGGDDVRLTVSAGRSSAVTVTTTAAEKVYRADGLMTSVELTLRAEPQARLDWLPQETILFDGARLGRRLDAAVAADAHLLVAETLVFGRLAMGEVLRRGFLRDRWRVRREGRLVFAEDLLLDGAMAETLDRPALGRGARATSTILYVSPEAEAKLDAVRAALEPYRLAAGASAWNGLLLVRALSTSPAALRAAILAVFTELRGSPPPRSWL